MLLILLAMIIGSSLTAFSSPIGSSANTGLSGLRLLPQKPGNDAPFSAAERSAGAGCGIQQASAARIAHQPFGLVRQLYLIYSARLLSRTLAIPRVRYLHARYVQVMVPKHLLDSQVS